MTNSVIDDGPDAKPGHWAQRAEQIMEDLFTALDGAVEVLDTKQELDSGLKKRIDEMRAMQVLVLKEGERLNDLNRKIAGAERGAALDLDGARAEIECRLACLRNAAGAE